MARYGKDKDDAGRIKVRVIDLEVEGNNATLQAGLRDFAAALNRSTHGAAGTLPAKELSLLPNGTPTDHGAADGAQEVEATEVTPAAEAGASQPARAKGPRRYPQPKFLDQLDLKSGPVPFKDFVKQKGPTKDSEKYLVIAAWLKQYSQIHAVTIDEIHTCYRSLGWQTDGDVAAPLRAMKSRDWFKKAPKKGSYEILQTGLDKVAEMGARQPT